jgi:glutamate synthase (NADPH) large chain
VPLDEVEPAAEIVKRFCTGAMSFGSISPEAHEGLAIAMNRWAARATRAKAARIPNASSRCPTAIPALGDQTSRLGPLRRHDLVPEQRGRNPDQDLAGRQAGRGRRTAGPQSGREHRPHPLLDARRRPDQPAAAPRHLLDRGPGAIDPRSEERQPSARISVKLVAKSASGPSPQGVAKAHADHILISGDTGGTGASPLTSIKHAGLPWELGIAETHQTLVMNDLRSRVVLQTDGGMRTGRDVVIAALLGAEEMGFSTAPLITWAAS